MENLTVPVVMVVAIWGGYGHLLRSYELLNRDRDRVISGVSDGVPLSVEHQIRIVRDDWSPLHIGLIAFLISFGMIFISLPLIGGADSWVIWLLCIFMSICPFFAALAFLVGWRRDLAYLRSIIDKRLAQIERDQSTKNPSLSDDGVFVAVQPVTSSGQPLWSHK